MTVHPDHASIVASLHSILGRIGTGAPFAPGDDLFEHGIVRSLDMMELVTALEDTFGIEVAQRDVFEGHLRTVERLVAYVATRRQVAS